MKMQKKIFVNATGPIYSTYSYIVLEIKCLREEPIVGGYFIKSIQHVIFNVTAFIFSQSAYKFTLYPLGEKIVPRGTNQRLYTRDRQRKAWTYAF